MRRGYTVGIFWSLVGSLISALNDLIGKWMGLSLGGEQVLFYRFFFGALVLLPFLLLKGPHVLVTRNMKTHALRGGLFALAMLPWSYGLIDLPLPLVTAISFTTPLFVVALAKIFLKEQVGWLRGAATLVGFLGVCLSCGFSLKGVNPMVFLAIVATILFASLDIINKFLVGRDEGFFPMIFYSSLFASLFVLPLFVFKFAAPSWHDVVVLGLLGCGANAFLFCLLKSFEAYEISALQPFRYVEFLFSSVISVVVFNQWPSMNVLAGICLIVPAVLYLSYHEMALSKKAKLQEESASPKTSA